MHPITVIITNWNGAKFLPTCLEALARQTYTDFEILVIDNGSTDELIAILKNDWPDVRLIQLAANRGFAAANNLGAQQAESEWIAFLNNDAYPEPGWLAALMTAAWKYPEHAFFASRILLTNPPELLDSAGDVYHISGNAWHRGYRQLAEQYSPAFGETFSACAAAALIRRGDFNVCGGFDEDYFAYMEDIDLGFRLRLINKPTLYVPDAIVRHVGSATAGIESGFTVYHVHRNLVWCYLVNMPGGYFWLYLPAHLLSTLIFLIYYVNHHLGKSYLKSKWDALRGMGKALQKRKRVQSQRNVRPGQVVSKMDHGLLSPYLLGRSTRRLQRFIARDTSNREE